MWAALERPQPCQPCQPSRPCRPCHVDYFSRVSYAWFGRVADQHRVFVSCLNISTGSGPCRVSPRYSCKRGVILVSRFGRPDYFVTMTASPAWPEIANNLRKGEKTQDRPDLVARVFRLKLRALLNALVKEHFLGKVIAHTYVVEYQKRGLPHAHILLIMVGTDKPRTPNDIDLKVIAEIPCRDTEPELYNLVDTFMVHGPCGSLNPECPCMDNGVRSKHYPKPLSSETIVNVNGYPQYRRRHVMPDDDQPRTVKDGNQGVQWIVPCNPRLLLRFRCHINIEVCTTIRAVKDLYKYSYKGPDRASLEYTRDEIRDFLDTRWVALPEANTSVRAAWQISPSGAPSSSPPWVAGPLFPPWRRS